jgi:sugar (pentulose or hexulose) kinase
MNFAIYMNGTLSSTNFGNDITGNVYVSGDVSTNSAASVTVDGNLRVGGSFASNAAVVSKGNVVIGGDMSTNGSAPITANQHGVYSHWFGQRWLVGGASNAGGRVLRQFFSDAQMTALTPWLRPDQPTGLDYRPLPGVGERFPVADPTLLPRLEPRPADDAVFFQGLLESLARTEAEGYALLQRLGAPPLQKVWAVGGGARNPVYEHIRAQALAAPVVAAMESDACVGVARLARQGPSVFV